MASWASVSSMLLYCSPIGRSRAPPGGRDFAAELAGDADDLLDLLDRGHHAAVLVVERVLDPAAPCMPMHIAMTSDRKDVAHHAFRA
jgi:hypothetical protein